MNSSNWFRNFRWKLFFALWGLSVLGLFAVIPYSLALQAETLAKIKLPMSLTLLILVQCITNAFTFGLLIFLGLFLAQRLERPFPVFNALLYHRPAPLRFRRKTLSAITLGLLVGTTIIVLDKFIFTPQLLQQNIKIPESAQPAVWKGLLASLYGGITEEALMRLFLLTFFVWLAGLLFRCKGKPSNAVFWFANLLSAALFGLGHLPATAALGIPLSATIVARALVLNGLGGVVFGWLYWHRGIAFAMIAHLSADIALHVLLPLMTG